MICQECGGTGSRRYPRKITMVVRGKKVTDTVYNVEPCRSCRGKGKMGK